MKKIITMYGKKQNSGWLIYVIVFLILLAMYLLVIGKSIKMSIMVGIMALCFFVDYKAKNRYKKQELSIIENGEVFEGKVLRVEWIMSDGGQMTTRLLVEFFEGTNKKFIMTSNFPYPISFQEENNSETNLIEFTQYYQNNCISFKEDGKDTDKLIYEGTINSNFEGELTCKVYKYKDKYIVDDFEGYEKIKKTAYFDLLAGILITIMLGLLAVVVYSVFFQS